MIPIFSILIAIQFNIIIQNKSRNILLLQQILNRVINHIKRFVNVCIKKTKVIVIKLF